MGSLLVCITHDCVHGYRDYKDRKAVLVRKKNKFRLELVKLVLFNVQCSPCLMLASFLQFLHSLQHTVFIMQTPMKVCN